MGEELSRVFVRSTVPREEFYPVALAILEGRDFGLVRLVRDGAESGIDRLEDFQHRRQAIPDLRGDREILRVVRVARLHHRRRHPHAKEAGIAAEGNRADQDRPQAEQASFGKRLR